MYAIRSLAAVRSIRNFSIASVAFIALIVACPQLEAASLPPANYIRTWTPNASGGVGHINGIPAVSGTARNVVDYGADATGVVPCDAAVAAARAAMRGSDYLYFPAGRFKLTNPISNWRGGAIRGAGMTATTLVMMTGDQKAISFGVGSALSNPNGSDDDVTSTFTRGTSSVDINYTGDFAVGGFICIYFSNDNTRAAVEGGFPAVVNASGGDYFRRHMARVTSVANKTITFEPGLFHTPGVGQKAYARASQIPSYDCGLQGLTVDLSSSNATFGIGFEDVYGGWMQDVKVKAASRYHIFVVNSMYFEMRECVLEDGKIVGSTNTAGLLMHNSTGSLIEDNAFIRMYPGIEINYGSSNNVFAFNYFDGCTANINHGPLNQYNLYEGNIVSQIKSDGYFGGSHYDAIFGNWITGRLTRTDISSTIGMVELKRFTYMTSVVRNYFGTTSSTIAAGSVSANWGKPNIGNSSSVGTAQASKGDWWLDWDPDNGALRSWAGTVASGGGTNSGVLSFANVSGETGLAAHVAQVLDRDLAIGWSGGNFSGSAGTLSGNTLQVSGINVFGSPSTLPPNGTAITVFCNTSSMQEQDLDVIGTSFRCQNYYLSSTPGVTGFASGETDLAGNTISPSLFRSFKPTWFGNKPWPVFDTSRQQQPDYSDLPAAHRYINGNRDYVSSDIQPYIREVRIIRM